jgi:hypothetical protein
MNFNWTTTSRGFTVVEFKDLYGAGCSVQKSSLATEDAIWFGPDDADPKIPASEAQRLGLEPEASTGWVPYPIPKQVLMKTRMHLTREQVKALLPLLQHFVETGELPNHGN